MKFHLLIVVLIGAASLALASTPAPAREVTPADQIEFEQKKAQAHMQELQDRMYRLAEAIRELEPDDSARLLLAVQKAREELILEQMKDAMALLNKRDLDGAAAEQKEVIRKLEQLRELLLSVDIDFRVKLERMKKIDAILKKLDPAIAEEVKLKDRSDEMGEQDPPDRKELDAAKRDQARNRAATDAIVPMVKELGPSVAGAVKELGGASGAMEGAEAKLGTGKPGEAAGQQGDAAGAMKRAKQRLEEEREKLRQELEKQVRDQVLESLSQMLERQTKVRGSTEALVPKMEKGGREALLAVQRLAPTEDRIAELCAKTITLIEETHFSVALPPALRSVERRMLFIAQDLKAGRASDSLVATEKGVEKDLAELIGAIKDSAPSDSQDPKEGQCGSCGGNKNKLLAELRIVRMLQVAVNQETIDADLQRAQAAAELNPEIKERVGTVREHQAQVRDTMDTIHKSACKDCAH